MSVNRMVVRSRRPGERVVVTGDELLHFIDHRRPRGSGGRDGPRSGEEDEPRPRGWRGDVLAMGSGDVRFPSRWMTRVGTEISGKGKVPDVIGAIHLEEVREPGCGWSMQGARTGSVRLVRPGRDAYWSEICPHTPLGLASAPPIRSRIRLAEPYRESRRPPPASPMCCTRRADARGARAAYKAATAPPLCVPKRTGSAHACRL